MKTYKIIFSGRVQGVGFRYTSCVAAKKLNINGYVKNLFNGDVELVAQCEPKKCDVLIKNIKKQMPRYILDIKINELEADGGFEEFTIEY